MVLVDMIISCLFLGCLIFHLIEDRFSTLNDKVIECIIGIGLSAICLLYSFFDGVRFLTSKRDQVLYLISCLLQKPILLPILFPNRFRSSEASENFSE
jgi:hypothetical protein